MTRTLAAELFDEHICDLGEGPLWDHRYGLWRWIDVYGRAVHTSDGATRATVEMPTPIGCVMLVDGGHLAVGLADGVYDLGANGDLSNRFRYAERPAAFRSNDGKPDPWGSLVVGVMAEDMSPEHGALYRHTVAADVLTTLVPNTSISNGMDWIDSSMWYIDSPTQQIRKFGYSPDGPLGDVSATIAVDNTTMGVPDGMTLDAEGCLWVAMWSGHKVIRFTPEGDVDTVVDVAAANVTACTFGGPDFSQLLITTASRGTDPELDLPLAGATFIVEPGVTGRQANLLAPTPKS